MAIRNYLCGISRENYQRSALQVIRQEPETTRLRTALHMQRQAATPGFRVLAVLDDGAEALVCLAATREEALERAKKMRGELPANAVRLRLQSWSGTIGRGFWRDLPSFGRGLRLLRRRRFRGRRPVHEV